MFVTLTVVGLCALAVTLCEFGHLFLRVAEWLDPEAWEELAKQP